MLRACRRVLKPGGRIAFCTIFIPPDLPEADYRRAARARNPGVTSWRREQAELLSAAGFASVREIDLTDEFLRVARAWSEGMSRHADELRGIEGEEFGQRLRDSRKTIAAIERGHLRRSLFVAERPD